MTIELSKIEKRFNDGIGKGNLSPAEKVVLYQSTIQQLEGLVASLKISAGMQLTAAVRQFDEKTL